MTARHQVGEIMSRSTRRHRGSPARVRGHRAFTLVEVMVVTVVLAVLASLVLSGLAGARNNAKADVTRSTIRKLHEIIAPHYETYARRRVTLPPSGLNAPEPTDARWQRARKYLNELRLLCTREMPDRWNDVTLSPAWNVTGPMRAYAAYRATLPANITSSYQDAECLAMIVLRGGVPPQEAEHFRPNEIGDADNDKAIEFLDGWRQPIRFVRWLKGYTLPGNDPMDPLRVSGTTAPPGNTPDPAPLPLLMSHGANGGGPNHLGFADIPISTGQPAGIDYPDWVEILTGTSRFRDTNQVNPRAFSTGDEHSFNMLYGTSATADDITNVKLWER